MAPQPDWNHVRRLYDYNPDTGSFTHKKSYPQARVNIGDPVGTFDGKERRTKINGHSYSIPMLIWFWVHNYWPKGQPHEEIHHRDLDPSNNRLDNLELVSTAENTKHKGYYRNNSTGFKGVSLHRDGIRYQAYRRVNGKAVYLGLFSTAEEASAAYNLHRETQ